MPDRIVAIKSSTARFAKVYFIELKKPGEELCQRLQVNEHEEMLALGMHVLTLSSRDEVDVWCIAMVAANA